MATRLKVGVNGNRKVRQFRDLKSAPDRAPARTKMAAWDALEKEDARLESDQAENDLNGAMIAKLQVDVGHVLQGKAADVGYAVVGGGWAGADRPTCGRPPPKLGVSARLSGPRAGTRVGTSRCPPHPASPRTI
jgi:hypothetical protein